MSGNVFDDNEALVKLLSDDELRLTSEIGHSLKIAIDEFLKIDGVRKTTLTKLEKLVEVVEKSYDNSRKARIAGTSATITGSAMTVLGFGLGFATIGASLGLTILGAVLLAAGGVTIGGAEIGYLAVARNKLTETEEACRNDNEEMKKIENLGREFSDHLTSLATKHPTFTKENIFHLLRKTWNTAEPAVKTLYNGYKVIGSTTDIGRNVITVTSTVRAGVQTGARTVYVGLGTVGRVFSIGSVVLDVLFVPIDFAVLVKSAHDVRIYKNGAKGGRSNSKAASNIRGVIDQLKDNVKELERVKNLLPGADSEITLTHDDNAIIY